MLREVVIAGYARTPIGSIGSSLIGYTAPQLGSIAIRTALERAKLSVNHVNEIIMGNVVSANIGQAPTRQAALGAGLPNSVVCTTVNKVGALFIYYFFNTFFLVVYFFFFLSYILYITFSSRYVQVV